MLGRYVPTALRRTPPVARLIHPIKLSILGILTAGLWPLHKLQKRVDRVLQMQAHQAELAGDLMALHAPADAKSLLAESTGRVRVASLPLGLSRLCFLAAICSIGWFWLAHHGPLTRLWLHPLRYGDPVARAFVALIAAAYVLLIFQMNRQIIAMQKLAIAVNGVFELPPPMAAPQLVFVGRSPLTILLGVALAWLGLAWALPMAVAWSAFKQFVTVSASGFRAELSDRLQTMSGITPVVDSRDLCPNPKCRQLIHEGAAFCTRCGTPVAAMGLGAGDGTGAH